MKPGWLCRRICSISKYRYQRTKVVRVNDVDLAEQRINGSVELRVTQVDVGLPGAVRRFPGNCSAKFIRKYKASFRRARFAGNCEPGGIRPLRRVKLRITHEKLEDLHPPISPTSWKTSRPRNDRDHCVWMRNAAGYLRNGRAADVSDREKMDPERPRTY